MLNGLDIVKLNILLNTWTNYLSILIMIKLSGVKVLNSRIAADKYWNVLR